MAVTLKQSGTAASSAASPTSITPALPVASTAGNLLILVVAVTGTTPSITTPANWNPVDTNTPAGLAMTVFEFVNNPGGITSVAVTVGGTGGGAAAAIFEFATSNVKRDDSNNSNGTATSYANIAFAVNNIIGELIFYGVGFAAATLTPTNSPEWSPVIGAAVSTNGTPNAQVASFWGQIQLGHTQTLGGSFSASVVFGVGTAKYNVAGSQQMTNLTDGGNAGFLVGQFYGGMIGG